MQSGVQFSALKRGKQFAGGWLVMLVVVIFAFVVLQITHGSVLPDGQWSARAVQSAAASPIAPGAIHEEADWLVAHCGRPDRDHDTGGFEPAPLIPERVLTYGKAHLKIAYLADGPKGQEPPYHWTLMALVDTRTNRAIDLSAFQSTVEQRLHCMLKK